MNKYLKYLLRTAVALACVSSQTVLADVGIGLRGGTLGYGIDFDVGMTEKLNLRLAYNTFSYSRTVTDTNVSYDGTLKISSLSGFLDWHAFGGGFRLSLGAVSSGPKVDVVGVPTIAGTYNIGGTTYTSAQIGSLNGQIKIGSSVAPYVGLGYGNVVGKSHRVTFLFDLGAIYGGTPKVSLSANCNPSLSSVACTTVQTQLQTDLAKEISDLESNASEIHWYPVINIGLGVRF